MSLLDIFSLLLACMPLCCTANRTVSATGRSPYLFAAQCSPTLELALVRSAEAAICSSYTYPIFALPASLSVSPMYLWLTSILCIPWPCPSHRYTPLSAACTRLPPICPCSYSSWYRLCSCSPLSEAFSRYKKVWDEFSLRPPETLFSARSRGFS